MNENSPQTTFVKKFARYNNLEEQLINNLPKSTGEGKTKLERYSPEQQQSLLLKLNERKNREVTREINREVIPTTIEISQKLSDEPNKELPISKTGCLFLDGFVNNKNFQDVALKTWLAGSTADRIFEMRELSEEDYKIIKQIKEVKSFFNDPEKFKKFIFELLKTTITQKSESGESLTEDQKNNVHSLAYFFAVLNNFGFIKDEIDKIKLTALRNNIDLENEIFTHFSKIIPDGFIDEPDNFFLDAGHGIKERIGIISSLSNYFLSDNFLIKMYNLCYECWNEDGTSYELEEIRDNFTLGLKDFLRDDIFPLVLGGWEGNVDELWRYDEKFQDSELYADFKYNFCYNWKYEYEANGAIWRNPKVGLREGFGVIGDDENPYNRALDRALEIDDPYWVMDTIATMLLYLRDYKGGVNVQVFDRGLSLLTDNLDLAKRIKLMIDKIQPYLVKNKMNHLKNILDKLAKKHRGDDMIGLTKKEVEDLIVELKAKHEDMNGDFKVAETLTKTQLFDF